MTTLAQLRKSRDWTQEQLADQIGVHWNTVARWERGDHEPPEPVRRLIALTFGVGIDAITYGKQGDTDDRKGHE